jgi:RHS repeat-associated protein
MAAMRLGGEKPHQGLPGRNPALYLGPTVCNSTTALGLQAAAVLNRIGSCSTGKERDQESGNDYFFARYYSSAMGRFLSPDWAAKAEPVPYAKLGDPQTLNLYGYLRNNPLGGVDADGHCGGGPNDPPCSEVKVEAKVTQQPKIEKNTPVQNSDGKVIAHGTGPTGGQLTDTVTVGGKPAEGVQVAEKNALKNTENGVVIPGSKNENPSTVPTDSNGQFVDNISMQRPAAGTAQGNNAIVNDMSTNVYTSTDKQTLTLTFPSGGTCTATSTRVMTNAGSDGQPSSTYTLRTTQPVVRDPSN